MPLGRRYVSFLAHMSIQQSAELCCNINTIYLATEGEGCRLGTVQVFIRFQGCAVGCRNCDSKETWDFRRGKKLTITEILAQLENWPLVRRVSITGGDPLHAQHVPAVMALARALKQRDYYLNIEAAGTRMVEEIFSLVDFISFDYKTPSSGAVVPLKHITQLEAGHLGKFQIKSVIENAADFHYTYQAYQRLLKERPSSTLPFPWCLTPAYTPGKVFSLEFFNWLICENQRVGGPFLVIGQQHKWIHGPDKVEV